MVEPTKPRWQFPTLSDNVRVLIGLTVFFFLGLRYVWLASANSKPNTAILWALACYVLGALIGFLFGIPRVLQGNSIPSAGKTTTVSPATASPTPAQSPTDGYDLRVNTNLEQISDWLTKIIVGLGLVELRNAPTRLKSAARYVASGLDPKLEFFAAGLILYFVILGFIGAYLITRLYITGAFSRADRAAMNRHLIELQVEEIAPLVPGKEIRALDVVEKKAAKEVASKPFVELTSPEEIAVWAKAKLSLGNYKDAVMAYGQIPGLLSKDLDKQFAYATALYYNADRAGSLQQLLKAYNRLTPATDPELRRNIYRSLTFQSLFQSPPRSFDDAIQYGEEYVGNSRNLISPGVWANLAAAYGQKMSWLLANNPTDQAALDQTKTRALAVVQQTAGMGERWKKKIREMMDKDFPNKDPKENDLEVFAADPDFRRAAGLPS